MIGGGRLGGKPFPGRRKFLRFLIYWFCPTQFLELICHFPCKAAFCLFGLHILWDGKWAKREVGDNKDPFTDYTQLITDRTRSIGEGYVFVGICLSTVGVHPGVGVSGGSSRWGALADASRGASWMPPPDTVNQRSIRILLECILVPDFFFVVLPCEHLHCAPSHHISKMSVDTVCYRSVWTDLDSTTCV